MITRLPKGLQRFQKKRKSSEFNPRHYEQVKSSPSLKVQSHESINDTVKLEGALKNGLLGKEWSKFTLKRHAEVMISHHKSKLILLGLPTPAFYFKTDIFPVLQKLTHMAGPGLSPSDQILPLCVIYFPAL